VLHSKSAPDSGADASVGLSTVSMLRLELAAMSGGSQNLRLVSIGGAAVM